jgi:O-antigen/teichoic acid export membrane protein
MHVRWNQIVSRLRTLRSEKDGLARRFLVAGAWNLSGNGVSQVIALSAQITVVQLLGKSSFGELAAVYSTLLTLGIFCGMGMSLTATKFIAELRDTDPDRTGRIIAFAVRVTLAVSAVMVVCVSSFTAWVAEHILADARLAPHLLTGALLIALSAWNTLQISILSGFEAFKKVAALNLLKALVSFPVLVLGARWGGAQGVIVGYLVIGAGFCAAASQMIRREASARGIKLGGTGAMEEGRMLLRFSLPAFVNSLLWPLSLWSVNLLILRLPGGYEKLAVLAVARQWQAACNFIPVALNSAVMPILTSVLSNQPSDRERSLRYVNLMSSLAILPVTLLLALAAPALMRLYGESYRDGWPILLVLVGATGVNLLNSPAGSLMLAQGRFHAALFNTVVSSFAVTGILMLVIERYELLGVVYLTLGCNLLSTGGIVYYSMRMLALPDAIGKSIISTACLLTGFIVALHLIYLRIFPSWAGLSRDF